MQSNMVISPCLKMEDAVAIKNALIEFVSNTTKEDILALKDDLILSKPEFDRSGRLRIGMWVYDSGYNVMINHLPPYKSCGYDYYAKLNRTDGKWVVESISRQEIFVQE